MNKPTGISKLLKEHDKNWTVGAAKQKCSICRHKLFVLYYNDSSKCPVHTMLSALIWKTLSKEDGQKQIAQAASVT